MKGVSWSCRSYLDVRWLGLMCAGRLLLPSWRSLMQVRVFLGAAAARDSFEPLKAEWFLSPSLSPFFFFHFHVVTQEHDITWGYLLTMEKEDLQKVEAGYAANCLSLCLSVSLRSTKSVGGAREEGAEKIVAGFWGPRMKEAWDWSDKTVRRDYNHFFSVNSAERDLPTELPLWALKANLE